LVYKREHKYRAGQQRIFRRVHFAISELFPAMLYMFAAVVVSDFTDEQYFDKFRHNPTALVNAFSVL
jgi:hypothetical protein